MSGLDLKKHVILEVAVIITDVQFNVLETYHRVVDQPEIALAQMDPWCVDTFKRNGLSARLAAKEGTPEIKVQEELLELIQRHYGDKQRVVLVGNSVGNDRRFIAHYWPAVAARLHYRIIDVSSFKEIFRQRFGLEFTKDSSHQALQDIQDSIAELTYYLSFVKAPQAPSGTP